MQLCTQKYITRRQRGVHLHPPYPPWIRHCVLIMNYMQLALYCAFCTLHTISMAIRQTLTPSLITWSYHASQPLEHTQHMPCGIAMKYEIICHVRSSMKILWVCIYSVLYIKCTCSLIFFTCTHLWWQGKFKWSCCSASRTLHSSEFYGCMQKSL